MARVCRGLSNPVDVDETDVLDEGEISTNSS